MADFPSLSHDEQLRRLAQLAIQAASDFGLSVERVTLLPTRASGQIAPKRLDRFGRALDRVPSMKRLLVPLLIALSGLFMASAWLVHLRFKDRIGFWTALLASWAIVLPEYALNVGATRYGYGTYSGSQMAAFHLCSGVVCVALVSRFVLGEQFGLQQLAGFTLLAAGMWLLLRAG